MYSGGIESYGSLSSYSSVIASSHQPPVPSYVGRGVSPALWTSSVSVVNPGLGGMYLTSYTAYNTGWSGEQSAYLQSNQQQPPGFRSILVPQTCYDAGPVAQTRVGLQGKQTNTFIKPF